MSLRDAILLGSVAACGAVASRAFEDSSSNTMHLVRTNGLAMAAAYAAGKVWQPEGKMGTAVAAIVTGGAAGMTNCSLKGKNERADVKSSVFSALAGSVGAWFVENYVQA